MKLINQNEEYEAVLREYSDMLNSVAPDTHNGTPCLNITTVEGQRFVVSVTGQGWSADGHKQVFETSEALLMSLSPQFAARWHSSLLSRLHTVAESTDDNSKDH